MLVVVVVDHIILMVGADQAAVALVAKEVVVRLVLLTLAGVVAVVAMVVGANLAELA